MPFLRHKPERHNQKGTKRGNDMSKLQISAIAVILACLSTASSDAATAETIFKATSQSVVLIRDIESHGSGVVLSSKGRILTSYHVVNTPLPLEVTAEVFKHGRKVSMTFKDVKVENVHKEYDLATVSVKLPMGVTMKPLTATSRTLATGEDCFVIGNPGGASGEALRNSISTGIISASERVFENKKYIQTTAAINPGNSGGALVDKNGRLIGIIAFIITDTEGIGFAIPIKGLSKSDFIEEKERTGNIQKAIEYERIGSEWYRRAQRLSGEDKEYALAIAYAAYRLSLSENSSDPSPYNNLGNIYVDMKEYETGKFFFQKAMELDGGVTPIYMKMLGICLENTGEPKKANELWKQGLLCKKDDIARGECAENLAITAINEKRYPEAAYLIKWSNSLGTARHNRASVRNKVYQEAVNELTDAQFKHISSKTEGFSFEDLAMFKAGRIRQSRPAVAKGPGKRSGLQTSNTSVAPSKRSGLQTSNTSAAPSKIFEKALKNAPTPPAEGLKKKIPESISDCRPAYGGVYLVMKFPELKKLGIFNIAQAKFEKYIPLSNPDALYACGGRTLLIYDPNQKIFQIYDMSTFQRTGSKMSRLQGVLTDINMGLLTTDKAVVSWADGTGALDRRHYGLLELPEMQITPFRGDQTSRGNGFRNSCYRDNIHIRLDPKLTRFVSWCTSHSPSGFIYGTISGLAVSSHYEHSSYGCLSLLMDRSRIVASAGKLMDTKGNVRHDFKTRNTLLFAVDGANMVIKVEDKSATVVDAINLTELQTFTLPHTMKASHWNKNDFTTDRLVFASAYLNRAAFVDNSGQQVVVFRLSGGQNADVLAEQLSGVQAGTLWTRKLKYAAGTRVTLEDSPEGVRFDSRAMTLSWQIPRTAKPGTHQMLISVVEPGKEEVYQRVAVTIR